MITGDTETEGQNLSSLFLDSLELELGLEGFTLVDSKLQDPDFLILGNYTIVNDSVEFKLEALVPGDDLVLFSLETREELQFALDRVLLQYARNLTESIIDFIEEHPKRFSAGPVREVDEDLSSESGDEEEPAFEESAEEESAAVPEKPITERSAGNMISERPAGEDGSISNFLFSADIGLFLSAGEAGRYMKTGFAPSFFGGYSLKPGLFGGLNLGIMFFQAEGYAAEAQGFIFSICPELRLKFDEGGSAVPGLRAAAGAAFFMVSPESGDTETKAVPAAEAGITMDYKLGKLVLTAAANIAVFYENGAFLYGFMPRIGVNL